MSVDNYCIVQTDEDGELLLSILPSKWVVINGWKDAAGTSKIHREGNDLCYWPRNLTGYRLLEKAKKDPSVPIDNTKLSIHRCKQKRNNFKTYSEAFREQKAMEAHSDTEEYEPRKKLKTDTSAADLFQAIQASKSRIDSTPRPVSPVLPIVPAIVEAPPEASHVNREPTHQFSESASSARQSADAIKYILDEITKIRHELALIRSDVTRLAEAQENSKVQNARIISLVSQLNAKVDIMAVQKSVPAESSYAPRIVTLTPVRCLTELEALNQSATDKTFIASTVESLGSIHGKGRYPGDGWTVCLQIVDNFFDREFLLGCSWTGTSRNKKEGEEIISKIAFHKYERVIDLFYQVVIYSDSSFTMPDCHKFLHRCLKNAKQRYEEVQGTRASVARKRSKKIPTVKTEKEDNVRMSNAEGENNDAVNQEEIVIEVVN